MGGSHDAVLLLQAIVNEIAAFKDLMAQKFDQRCSSARSAQVFDIGDDSEADGLGIVQGTHNTISICVRLLLKLVFATRVRRVSLQV